jgi:DnaJ-class molecular chaperone
VLHPDKVKNPTPATVKEFEIVQMAYEVLTDVEGRKALDAVLGAQVRAAQRVAALSSHRRQLQEDLERREKEASLKSDLGRAQSVLRQHMDRIRAENMTRMQQQQKQAASVNSTTATKRDREEVLQFVPTKKSDSSLVPHSQRFATLEEFEKYAFERLSSVK